MEIKNKWMDWVLGEWQAVCLVSKYSLQNTYELQRKKKKEQLYSVKIFESPP